MVAFLWLQLPFAKTYFIETIESNFNNRYHGKLTIGSVEGVIPFQATIHDISAVWEEVGFHPDTLIRVKKIDVSLNPLDLLSNRLSVQSLVVSDPVVDIKYDPNGRFVTLNRLFQSKEAPGEEPENVVRKISVLAPFFSVENGVVNVSFKDSSINKPMSITGIELSSFLEISDEFQFVDLQYLMANIDALADPFVQFKGQVYHDSNFLEFNGFRVWNAGNTAGLNGEIRNLDILRSNRQDQFLNATYSLNVDSTRVLLNDYSNIFTELGKFEHVLTLSARLNGSLRSLELDRFDLRYGNSKIQLVGEFTELIHSESLGYITDLRNVVINSDEIRDFIPEWDERLEFLNNVTTSGRLSGDLSNSLVDLRLESGESFLEIDGNIHWGALPRYIVELQTRDFDFSQLDDQSFPPSRVTSTITLDGSGIDIDNMTSSLSFSINNSRIDEYDIEELQLTGRYDQRNLSGDLLLTDGNAQLTGQLAANFQNELEWSLNGVFEKVNLRDYLLGDIIAETDLDFIINVNAVGVDTDDLTGQINLDVTRAVVGGDTLGPHQFYADLFGVEDGKRELRFTSTLLDLNLLGDLNSTLISEMGDHWINYFSNQVDEEYFLNDSDSLSSKSVVSMSTDVPRTMDLTFDLQVKDASLAKMYFPTVPNLEADLQGEGSIQATDQRILVNSFFEGSALTIGDATLRDYSVANTISLQYGLRFKDFSIADIVLRAQNYESSSLTMSDLRVSASINAATARIESSVGTVGQADYGGNAQMEIVLKDSIVYLNVSELNLGNQVYLWTLTEPASILYNKDRSIQVERFQLANNRQNLALKGTYSSDLDDAIQVDVTALDLATISDLIKGRSTFAGILDGTFETRSIFTDPVISGYFDVDHLKIDDRTIGDVNFKSNFNTKLNRFDVEMKVITNPTKYSTYLTRNNNIGQDIELKGWVNAPDNQSVTDTLFYFDVALNQIDGWIIAPIVPSVFERTEGVASGSGYIWGSSSDFDFNARLDVQEIRAVPRFLLTNYILSGTLELDRNDGVTFEQIFVRDTGTGTGVLTGNIGFNDFQVERPFNIEMTLNQLEFLNNSFDEDVPFYGRVFGSGRVSLTGSNQAPFLRTITPITTTSRSRLSIPLLDETSVEEQARFIEFVRSFSEIDRPETTDDIVQQIPESSNRFMETVTMDLQFIAPVNSSVQLVFDPLTGEILNAQGSGRIRITLEDQNFQMFGSFNVNSGEYVFVGGDIFVRRFQLRNGGTISWDGDPANASLNITTTYRTRPNIGVLSPALGDQQTRIPVDLMLVITGTIESIENSFYFEFPNATDVSQNASILSILNSEDQKLIQATSLLFTGGFIPVGVAGEGQTGELGASLQARAGQVGLSQLLSNQINAILNSSLSNLDIDLNLTGFDQADIGIALRLFDDRLILRGESQYSSAAETGAETTLGDLGITYRINRALSVEVFHRRDPTLRSIVGNQTQVESINGIGLEAQVQFNTWSEFRMRLWAQIRRFFGVNTDAEKSS